MEDTRTKHVASVVIDRGLWARAKAVAQAQDVSVSRYIRELIRVDLRRSDRAARKSP